MRRLNNIARRGADLKGCNETRRPLPSGCRRESRQQPARKSTGSRVPPLGFYSKLSNSPGGFFSRLNFERAASRQGTGLDSSILSRQPVLFLYGLRQAAGVLPGVIRCRWCAWTGRPPVLSVKNDVKLWPSKNPYSHIIFRPDGPSFGAVAPIRCPLGRRSIFGPSFPGRCRP